MFHPEHFKEEHWQSLLQKGYHLDTYLLNKTLDVNKITAAEFLKKAWGDFVENLTNLDLYIVSAVVITPEQHLIQLRVDRDFFEIHLGYSSCVKTLATWQTSEPFDGFRLDELWSNMVKLDQKYIEFLKKEYKYDY